MATREVIVHGRKRLLNEVENFCRECSLSRPSWIFCEVKNPETCTKVKEEFGGRLWDYPKDDYVTRNATFSVMGENR